MSENNKTENPETVEETEELEIKRVKTLKTNIKGGLYTWPSRSGCDTTSGSGSRSCVVDSDLAY